MEWDCLAYGHGYYDLLHNTIIVSAEKLLLHSLISCAVIVCLLYSDHNSCCILWYIVSQLPDVHSLDDF